MQYFAAHYWQAESGNTASVLLQQAYHKRRRMPVLLACVCTDTGKNQIGKRLTKSLADWFYETVLPVCARSGDKGRASVSHSLEQILDCQGMDEEQADRMADVAGVLCIGQDILLFGRGRIRMKLLNSRNHHSVCQELILEKRNSDGLCMQWGIIEKGVGILAVSEEFHTFVPNLILEECLNVWEVRSQDQLERRMRELGHLAQQNRGTDLGAVMIIAK